MLTNRIVLMTTLVKIFLLGSGFFYSPNTFAQGSSAQGSSDLETFDVAVKTIEENFYDPKAIDSNFRALCKDLRGELAHQLSARRGTELATVVNRLLQSLNTSHTYYLTANETEYYRIASVFQKLPKIAEMFKNGKVEYPSIGILPVQIDDQWFVQDVLPKSEAQTAGVRLGDKLLRVGEEPFQPISVLKPLVGKNATIIVERNGKELRFEIPVTLRDPQDEFLEALKASLQITTVDEHSVLYAHFYSYAGEEFQKVLTDAISWGEFADAEALVLDLRYGMGGANISYLNIFQRNIPKMTMIDRKGNSIQLNGQWIKPVVLIIDESTRSGKETVAYGAKKLGFAKLVGTPTAGAVIAGSPFPMPNGDLLYLAVSDVQVDDQRLEGNPVQPDILIPLDVKTCKGIDIQKQSAIKEAALQVEAVRRSREDRNK